MLPKIVELEPLETVVKATMYSAYVKGEKRLSLLIVAKPECGKTAVLKKYKDNKGLIYATDCTAYGLTRDVLPKIVSGEVHHILIADLITPLSKTSKTRQSFIAFLNNLIEEGVAKMSTYATMWDREAKCGLITAVTDDEFRDGRHHWAKMGFLSRMFVFSYSYPISTVHRVFESIIDDSIGYEEKVELNFPKELVDVNIPKGITRELKPTSMQIGASMNLHGFRFLLNSKTLLKSLALMKGRSKVSKIEFKEFMELSRYFNFKFNPI